MWVTPEIPADHWTQDLAVGGGRIIGEACHFIDLLRFLAGAPIVEHSATFMGARAGIVTNDKVSISLSFADGSFGVVGFHRYPLKKFSRLLGLVLRLRKCSYEPISYTVYGIMPIEPISLL